MIPAWRSTDQPEATVTECSISRPRAYKRARARERVCVGGQPKRFEEPPSCISALHLRPASPPCAVRHDLAAAMATETPTRRSFCGEVKMLRSAISNSCSGNRRLTHPRRAKHCLPEIGGYDLIRCELSSEALNSPSLCLPRGLLVMSQI
jgi:hypothetical protein